METGKTAKLFLEQIQAESNKSAFESLALLVEQLENKADPEPVEMHLVESIYSFLEQLKRMENNLQSYVNDTKKIPTNKLASLYESIEKKNIWD